MDPATISLAIMAGKAVAGYIGHKKAEKRAAKDARREYDSKYNSPLAKALQDYIREYWTKNNLQARLPSVSIDQLLAPPAFDKNATKIPGGGAQLGSGLMDALDAYYGGMKKPAPGGTTAASSVPSSSASPDVSAPDATFEAPDTAGLNCPPGYRWDPGAPLTGHRGECVPLGAL